MADNTINNNQAVIEGIIDSDFVFDHEVFGEKFYIVKVAVKRLSNNCDIIPVTVSERLVDVTYNQKGLAVMVAGQFRSFNKYEETGTRLVLALFAREMEYLMEEDAENTTCNRIHLEGTICKAPVYRQTPLGREVTDLLLAVNRPYGKSDYIPCICWGRNARFAGKLQVGEKVAIDGRIQSREYTKKFADEHAEARVAYEVSVNTVERLYKDDGFSVDDGR